MTTLQNYLCKLEKWTYNENGIKRDQSGVSSLGKWSLALLSLVKEHSLFLSLFLGAGRAQLVKCSHQDIWGECGFLWTLWSSYCFLSKWLRSRHVTQFWPEASTLHSYKEACWKPVPAFCWPLSCLPASQPSHSCETASWRSAHVREAEQEDRTNLSCWRVWTAELANPAPSYLSSFLGEMTFFLKKYTLFFRTVLDLWDSWEDGKEFLYIPLPSFLWF